VVCNQVRTVYEYECETTYVTTILHFVYYALYM